MFYYISFLRPPPTASSTHTSLLITPQIANDLRTETCPNAHDIYYSWLPSAGLKPQKLTSWNPKNPYPKPVPVPLPSPLVLGKTYTLALSCNGSPVVPLTNVSANPLPFPVLSKPVRFYQGREEIKKQEQIDRIYTLVEKDRIIVSEQTSFDLDKVRNYCARCKFCDAHSEQQKIWDSGIGLSAWLTDLYQDRSEERHQEPLVKKLRDILFAPERVDIIELGTRTLSFVCSATHALPVIGAGTGIVSLVVAALRYRLLRPQNSHHDDLPQDPSPSTIEPGRIIITDLGTRSPISATSHLTNTFRRLGDPSPRREHQEERRAFRHREARGGGARLGPMRRIPSRRCLTHCVGCHSVRSLAFGSWRQLIQVCESEWLMSHTTPLPSPLSSGPYLLSSSQPHLRSIDRHLSF